MPLYIQHIETLVFYDVPQVFVAKDRVGTHYLCVLVENSINGNDVFLCVAISSDRILQFKQSHIDLRTLFEHPEIEQWFTATSSDIANLFLEEAELNTEWLPDPDFFFESDVDADTLITQEAIEKNRPIIHLSLNPPESKDETKISLSNLAIPLLVLDRILYHAFKKVSKTFKQSTDSGDILLPEVFAQSNGSFKVHVQTQPLENQDLYEDSLIKRTIEIIHKMIELSDNRNNNIENHLDLYKGHLLSSYKAMLDYIVENSAPINLSFSIPHQRPIHNMISIDSAKKMQSVLNERKELAIEIVELVGVVSMADSRTGNWILQSSDKQYSGKVKKNVSLDGIVVNTQQYQFHCEEHVLQHITGKEVRRLSLIEWHTV